MNNFHDDDGDDDDADDDIDDGDDDDDDDGAGDEDIALPPFLGKTELKAIIEINRPY